MAPCLSTSLGDIILIHQAIILGCLNSESAQCVLRVGI